MSYSATSSSRPAMTLVQIAAMVVGAVFLVVGILGFVPGITTNVDKIELLGHESQAKLLDLFEVSILHNVVHLLFGVVGLAAGRASTSAARSYLLGGGIVYLVLWIYGLVVEHGSDANFVPLNDADNWLHLALAIGMIALALVLPRQAARTASRV